MQLLVVALVVCYLTDTDTEDLPDIAYTDTDAEDLPDIAYTDTDAEDLNCNNNNVAS
jgi:hypothetical protein